MPEKADILSVTLNPALDISTVADRVCPGPKLRCDRPQVDPGGGGVNVARMAHRLGAAVRAFVAVGGAAGDQLLSLLQAEGVAVIAMAAPGDTRQAFAVTDRSTGEQYRFGFPGPTWPKRAAATLPRRIAEAARQGGFVVLSGSQPPGVDADLPERLAGALGRHRARLIVDTSGPALTRLRDHPPAAGQRPFVLRMDSAEAEAMAGRALPDRGNTADFAQQLVRQGVAEIVIIARGGDGSTLATATERVHADAARVTVKSKIGAGDSFVGAFTAALARGATPARALQEGSAAASAAVMTPATELCRPQAVRRLIAACPVAAV